MTRFIAMQNGKVKFDKCGNKNTPISEFEEMAELGIRMGYADYIRIEVDGEVYAEYEA